MSANGCQKWVTWPRLPAAMSVPRWTKRREPGAGSVRVVRQVRAQPSLRLADALPAAARVVLQLVLRDPAHVEVPGLGMCEVEAGHRRGGGHGERVRQVDADLTRCQQIEQLTLLTVVGTRRVAERRPDAAVLLGDQLLVRQRRVL